MALILSAAVVKPLEESVLYILFIYSFYLQRQQGITAGGYMQIHEYDSSYGKKKEKEKEN